VYGQHDSAHDQAGCQGSANSCADDDACKVQDTQQDQAAVQGMMNLLMECSAGAAWWYA
jgi:hypothetical protein